MDKEGFSWAGNSGARGTVRGHRKIKKHFVRLRNVDCVELLKGLNKRHDLGLYFRKKCSEGSAEHSVLTVTRVSLVK